jgi:hypothetical protein
MTRVVSNTFSLTVRDPSVLPTWRQGLAQWEWVELTGTAELSGAIPSDLTGFSTGGASPSGRINAWNGFAASGRSVYIAGMGGHADWPGNEAYQIDLDAAIPAWVMLREPSPQATWSSNVAYYSDGRPSSAHLYYALHAVGNEIIRVMNGSQWGDGNGQDTEVVAFDLATNDWRAEGTYADAPSTSLARAICQDPSDGTIYFTGDTHLHRRHPTTGVWTQLAAWPNNGSATYYRASAVDTTRERVVFFGDAYRTPLGGFVYDIAGNSMSTIDFNSADSNASATAVAAQAGNSAWYDATLDRFIAKTGTGNNVYLVHPTTWAVTEQATTGGGTIVNAVNGTLNRFVHVPDLGGIYYQPSHASNGWFLATE